MLFSPFILLILAQAAFCVQSANGPPNIVLILADDLGYHDIGYNNPKMKTPHMDRLAHSGRKLLQSYFQSTCSPSRAALLTGIYPYRLQVEEPFEPLTPHCLPTNVKILPQYLKEAGYKTHLVGKWHLGFCQKACLPNERGFDTFDGLYVGMGDYYNHTDCEGFRNYDWHSNADPDKTVLGKYITSYITDKAVDILTEHKSTEDGPFFMFLSHTAPHVPLQAPKKFEEMYNNEPDRRRATLKGQITALDTEIGRFVSVLKSKGFYDNTIILFSSDNGGEGFAGPGINEPFRGTKCSLWEGGSRVVGFVHSPLLENLHLEGDGLLHVVDWFPSLLSIAGVDPAAYADQDLDGVDQSGLFMRGEESKRTEVAININPNPVSVVGHNAIRMGNYKLLWGFVGIGDGWGNDTFIPFDPSGDIFGDITPKDDIEFPYARLMTPVFGQLLVDSCLASMVIPGNISSGEVHLFDLKEDPGERNDLAGDPDYQQRILTMKQRIIEHIEKFKPTPPRPSYKDAALQAMVDGTWMSGWCEDLDITI